MVKRKRKTLFTILALSVALAVAGGAVGAYAWYRSETEAKVVYVVPTANSLIIQFDSAVTKDVAGTLYPAIVDEEAVADNAWNDPSRIVTQAGRVTFKAQFTMYGGTGGEAETGDAAPEFLDLRVALAARVKNNESNRDLLETGELSATVDFSVGGTTVRLSENRLFVPAGSGWTEVAKTDGEGVVAFYLDGACHIATSADYLANPRGTPVVRDGKLVVLTDTPVVVKTETYLTTPDVVTAKDLKGGKTKIQIALSVRKAEDTI